MLRVCISMPLTILLKENYYRSEVYLQATINQMIQHKLRERVGKGSSITPQASSLMCGAVSPQESNSKVWVRFFPVSLRLSSHRRSKFEPMTGKILKREPKNESWAKTCYHRSSTNMIAVISIVAIYSVTDKLLIAYYKSNNATQITGKGAASHLRPHEYSLS